MSQVTHELLQLVTVIHGEADVLLASEPDPVMAQRRLRVIKYAARQISEMLQGEQDREASAGRQFAPMSEEVRHG